MNDEIKDRILVVDDDVVVLKLLLNALKDHYNVLVAPVAYDIETLIHHHKPDLIILDIGLPEESGQDLCKNFRNNQDFDHMAVLFLSGLDKAELAAATIQSRADGYLTKPFDLPVLRRTIAQIIQTKRATLNAGAV